jgi:hypothetical protein
MEPIPACVMGKLSTSSQFPFVMLIVQLRLEHEVFADRMNVTVLPVPGWISIHWKQLFGNTTKVHPVGTLTVKDPLPAEAEYEPELGETEYPESHCPRTCAAPRLKPMPSAMLRTVGGSSASW